MNEGRTVFSQLMDWFPLAEFRRLVREHRGDYRVRRLSCLGQFYIMAFAQLSYRESLRDIETFLRAAPTKPYHLGIRARISHSTLYKSRWSVELFFKWIKQHLRLKAFFGTSLNAVKTQVWIALSVYLLLALMKKEWNLPHSLHAIAQLLSLSLFQKLPLPQLFTETKGINETPGTCNSLPLLDV